MATVFQLHDQVITVFCNSVDSSDRSTFYGESLDVITDIRRIIITKIKSDAVSRIHRSA